MNTIDLYSGIGGASEGFRQAGYKPAFACDSDPDARLVFANNFFVNIINDITIIDTKDVPHPEIMFASPPVQNMSILVKLMTAIQPRVILFEYPTRMVDMEKIAARPQLEIAGYKCWHTTLNSADYGLPQKRKYFYIVGFRKDVKITFNAFTFPEPIEKITTLRSILETNPDQKLLISQKRLESINKRNEANAAMGFGFKHHVLTPDDIAPALPVAYYKDYRGICIDSGHGPRRLSVLECKRLMGFSDTYRMPVSDTNAYRLLASASCPPIIKAIAEEIRQNIS
jgi:DNA (cytosine-5)-methyltransferase 1